MRQWWKQEPILQFELETVKGTAEELTDKGKPCGKKTYLESITFSEVLLNRYWQDALFWYKKAALQNEPLAIRLLQSVADFEQAKRKAEAGDKDAQYLLSVYYHDSYGTPLDLYTSAEWLRRAALNGSRDAIAVVNDWNAWTNTKQSLTDKNFYAEPDHFPESYEYLYMIERHGRHEKQYLNKTQLTELWVKLCKLDFEETEYYARTGEVEKQYQLAWLHDWGIGCEQNMKEAIRWFVEAAFNQYAPAQTELGIMYHYGIMATQVHLTIYGGKRRTV